MLFVCCIGTIVYSCSLLTIFFRLLKSDTQHLVDTTVFCWKAAHYFSTICKVSVSFFRSVSWRFNRISDPQGRSSPGDWDLFISRSDTPVKFRSTLVKHSKENTNVSVGSAARTKHVVQKFYCALNVQIIGKYVEWFSTVCSWSGSLLKEAAEGPHHCVGPWGTKPMLRKVKTEAWKHLRCDDDDEPTKIWIYTYADIEMCI